MNSKTAFTLLALVGTIQSAPAAIIPVTTTDNSSGPGDGLTSLVEAIQQASDGDTITFAIPGTGPHTIQTPLGGYPLITRNNLTIDGYTQPGALPNTNPILGGNNAQIKIVLDSTGTDSAPNPNNPARPLRRSTRLDFPEFIGNTGYGETENGILAVFEADNVTIRGLSFLARHTPGSEADPSIYCVALVKEATGTKVQGCWFGLPPGGSTMGDVRPAASAVAAFRWRIGGDVYSERLTFGTDGDGTLDRTEFNVALGCHIALALELPRARVSGNYLNVFPDGLTFVDVEAIHAQLVTLDADDSVETFENGRVTDDSIVGTDGNGTSDSDERNIFGHSVYDHDIEFYSSAVRAVIAGNYFGVGIDGVTTAPLPTSATPDLIELPGTASIRIGSNGDGISDDIEGNLIHNIPGSGYCVAGSSVPIITRGNRMVNNNFRAIPFGDGENGRAYASYYAAAVVDATMVRPVLGKIDGGMIAGKFAAPSSEFQYSVIDLYLIDPAALAKPAPSGEAAMVHPLRLLGSFQDGGPGDLELAPNEFKFDLSGFGLSPTTYVAVAVSYSMDAGVFNAARSVTSPMSNPVSVRPRLEIKVVPHPEIAGLLQSQLSWLAAEGAFEPQINGGNLMDWDILVPPITYTNGRNTTQVDQTPGSRGRILQTNRRAVTAAASIPGQIFRALGEEAGLPVAFFLEEALPELLWIFGEDDVEAGRIDQPAIAF